MPNGDNGWYRAPCTVAITCNGTASPMTCPSGAALRDPGPEPARPVSASDVAGNVGSGTVPAFNFDNAAPRAAALRQPTPRAIVTTEPTFVFGPSTGPETSGFNRYEVYVRIAGTYRLVASVPHVVGQAEYRVTRDPSLWPTVFPKGVSTSWYVRTIDNAGNGGGGTGQARAFTINPNAPAPPDLHRRPRGPHQRRLAHLQRGRATSPASRGSVFAADERHRPADRLGRRDPGHRRPRSPTASTRSASRR